MDSDGHTSYKGYASDINIKHFVLRADIRQRVRQSIYNLADTDKVFFCFHSINWKLILFNNGTQFFYIEIGMVDGKLSMIHSWKDI